MAWVRMEPAGGGGIEKIGTYTTTFSASSSSSTISLVILPPDKYGSLKAKNLMLANVKLTNVRADTSSIEFPITNISVATIDFGRISVTPMFLDTLTGYVVNIVLSPKGLFSVSVHDTTFDIDYNIAVGGSGTITCDLYYVPDSMLTT